MANKIKIATVFSGIGAIEFAFKRLNIPTEIVFACDSGEREIEYDIQKEQNTVRSLQSIKEKHDYVDNLYTSSTRKTNFVEQSYLANYPISKDRFYQDIRLLDGTDFENENIDLLVGGSPCQSFSSIGFQKGLEDARGTLFYEFGRLIKETKPKIFIYENVRNMLKHDKGHTWEVIEESFKELGYQIDYGILNAKDFGIPQNRNRLFVIGIRNDFSITPDISHVKKKNIKYTMQDFLETHCEFTLNNHKYFTYSEKTGAISIKKNHPGTIDDRYYLSEAVERYVRKDGTKNWKQKAETDLPIARTLLKTMGNCHRAGVDNYITTDGPIRMLTQREALRLMGFTDEFIQVVSISQMYKQAGNSIVVDIMMEIVKYLMSLKIMGEE